MTVLLLFILIAALVAFTVVCLVEQLRKERSFDECNLMQEELDNQADQFTKLQYQYDTLVSKVNNITLDNNAQYVEDIQRIKRAIGRSKLTPNYKDYVSSVL